MKATSAAVAAARRGRAFAGMRAAQERIVDAGRWVHGPSSLMGALGLSRDEVANCRVLRWLFDPMARHGLGADFIGELGNAVGVGARRADRAHAEAEVSRACSRADVVVSGAGDEWTVVIEAKVDAGEGERQAARLEQDWPDATAFVFLSGSGVRIPTTATDPSRWRALGWSWVADTALRLLDSTAASIDGRAAEARDAVAHGAAAARRELR